MSGRDLAHEVTPAETHVLGDGDGPRIAMIDTGAKHSIVENLRRRGATVDIVGPDAGSAHAIGGDLMNPSRRPGVLAEGFRQGALAAPPSP